MNLKSTCKLKPGCSFLFYWICSWHPPRFLCFVLGESLSKALIKSRVAWVAGLIFEWVTCFGMESTPPMSPHTLRLWVNVVSESLRRAGQHGYVPEVTILWWLQPLLSALRDRTINILYGTTVIQMWHMDTNLSIGLGNKTKFVFHPIPSNTRTRITNINTDIDTFSHSKQHMC